MTDDRKYVEAVNRAEGIALISDKGIAPISSWIDEEGRDCEEPDGVVAIVGPYGEEKLWFTVDMSSFERAKTQ
jgi:hypothetical protein